MTTEAKRELSGNAMQRERRLQRRAERAIARTGDGAAYTVRGVTYGTSAGYGMLAQTAERIRRDAAAGKPWQPFKPAAR